jgi:hypothetical protein
VGENSAKCPVAHRPMPPGSLPQHRVAAMTLEERAIVKDMSALGHNPRQILNKLQQANQDSQLILQDVYNLLASLCVKELSGKTLVEWLL